MNIPNQEEVYVNNYQQLKKKAAQANFDLEKFFAKFKHTQQLINQLKKETK